MLCQKCKQNNATSHIHYVRNGVVRDIYLCKSCATEYKAENLYDGDIFKVLSSLLSDGANVTKNTDTKLKCDCCGSDFNEIRRTGKVGCSNCYKVFEAQLSPTVARIHKNTVHIGKKPNDSIVSESVEGHNENEAASKEQTITGLKRELAEAIKNEEYEIAAVIRDKIKGMEE